jgi:hypothetical protein
MGRDRVRPTHHFPCTELPCCPNFRTADHAFGGSAAVNLTACYTPVSRGPIEAGGPSTPRVMTSAAHDFDIGRNGHRVGEDRHQNELAAAIAVRGAHGDSR